MATNWTAFVAFVVLLTAGIVALTRASARLLSDETTAFESIALLVQTTVSQAGLGVLLVAGVWIAQVPLEALGMVWGPQHAALGVLAGVAFYLGNEVTVYALDAAGLGYEEALREALTPETGGGWLLLLFVTLPIVAGVEELLFRGVLVGALSVGFGVSPWVLAVGSSLVFGAAHTAQGATGVFVTSLLGFGLAAVYVVTGSLFVVFLAHYLVNVLEFAVHARKL
jgi:membrane protease YdiL (CAAX protease family)